MNKYFIFLMISVLIAAVSQLLLKISANRKHDNIISEYLNVKVMSGYFLLFLSTILTILAFKGLEYKNGPIIETTGYVYILILSSFVLKEKITKKKILGNLIIILGIVIFYI